MNRRRFIRNTGYTAAIGYLNTLPLPQIWDVEEIFHLTLMHTNDVHSRVDPFPMDGSRNEGQGGVAKRKLLIDKIRAEGQQTLLLDAGDIFQGTPYFNLFGGEIEMKLMTELGYDVATIGNHDFDGGIEGFNKQLKHADFQIVTSNYDVSNTVLSESTIDHKIWEFDGIKIGLYALGIELDGMVPKDLYLETQYMDPIKTAKKYEKMLKQDHDCDYVICLSHLGYKYKGDKVSDVVIANETSHTDLIIGGHTHTFMYEPHIENNKNGRPVIINQVGFAGILMGRIDLYFERGSKRKAQKGTAVSVKTGR